MNGDGRQDAILSYGTTTSGSLAPFLQDPSGALVSALSVGSYYAPSPIESGDLNGDGRMDLAVLHEKSTLGIYLQSGTGGFAERPWRPSRTSPPTSRRAWRWAT